jgi:alpha-galactosidase
MKSALLLIAASLLGVACSKDPSQNGARDGGSGGGTGSGGSSDASRPPPIIDASSAADPAVSPTPPMGWNSWNKFQGAINDTIVRGVADAIVAKGLADVGYQYLVIDDTWQAASRDASGALVSDPGRFPDMKALADYVHGKGLKFGIYSDRGTATCAGRPGSFGHEIEDARTFAAWGVDYLKYDNCNESPQTRGLEQDFRAMGAAINATGRPMVYSISAWWFYAWEPVVGHLWRTTTDITDDWISVMSLANRNGGDTTRYGSCTGCPLASAGMCVVCNPALPEAAYGAPGLSSYAKPGHFNDPDMLEVGNGGMSDVEYRSHFSLWAIMAAPLIMGNDTRNVTPGALEILSNREVIAVDQDPLVIQGKPVSADKTLEVWAKKLSGADTYAVLLLNRSEVAADITVAWSTIGLASTSALVRDLWAHQDVGVVATQYTATAVPRHGVVMLKVIGQ